MLCVGLELGVFTFVDAGAESFFQALSLRIDILPDTAFWNLLGDINGACLIRFFPVVVYPLQTVILYFLSPRC